MPAARPHRWVLHPLLLAAYPVLFLFTENATDQMTLDPLWLPLAAAVGGAALLLLVGTALIRDVHRAGIAASVLVVAFFWFGHAWNLVGDWFRQPWALLVVWAIAVAIGLTAAWAAGARARSATVYLNLVAAIPVVFTLAGLGEFVLERGAPGTVLRSIGGLLGGEDRSRPDIYYLVFDRYAGSPALERHFDFDNEPFLRELEKRGFHVARNSVANYVKTGLSLTSTLDMDYLDADALNAAAATPADQGPINRRFQGHLLVPGTLKELGYQFVLIPSWWRPTASNVDADLTLRYEGASEFSLALLETTLVGALTDPAEEVDPFSASELRNYTLHALDQALEAPGLPGPKFVLAHFLIPHPPYLFDRDGGSVTADEARERSNAERYLRQLEFTNARILEIVDEIQARPAEERPVIIVQADEGPFPPRYAANGESFQWEAATPEELEIKFRILNAIHLPGVDPEDAGLSSSMTPVNTFRIVFNVLFGADLPLLPDRVYAHADYLHYYDFVEVTDRIPGWPAP
jgi:hypothetical protein